MAQFQSSRMRKRCGCVDSMSRKRAWKRALVLSVAVGVSVLPGISIEDNYRLEKAMSMAYLAMCL